MAIKLGWCLTGHHRGCRQVFESNGKRYECCCDCHKSKEVNDGK